MNRRELLFLSGTSLVYAGLRPLGAAGGPLVADSRRDGQRLFFEPADVPRIKANARTPLLKPMYDEWVSHPVDELAVLFDKFDASGDFIRDFHAAVWQMSQSAMVQLIDPSAARERSILEALGRLSEMPYWDYFRDGGAKVLGIQRASYTAVRALLAREVLGSAMNKELEDRLVRAIGDNGCQACYNTVYGMEHPGTVVGWDFDEKHAGFYDITMERWPMILGANNLRAAPTGALGLGALALQGVDDRADEWLALSVASGKRFLKLFSPDGSYFEGLSYLDYSLRTMLPFIQAHRRIKGDVDWTSLVNFDGVLRYVLMMQMGRLPDGQVDIVNFSDARGSVAAGSLALMGRYTGDPLSKFLADNASSPRWYFDLLWYDPDAPSEAPDPSLLNMRNDLNWIVCRTGWDPDDAVVAFKSGGPANHEHADRNEILFKTHGERLLTDQYGAAYDRRSPGWKLRQTEAHNAVLIDGRGHPYVDGTEGTNDSKAYATILRYEDLGDRVWWTSDASAAYILDNYHVHQVLRTVLFAKPDTLILLDQIRLRYRPQTVDLRFFPDNADGAARLFAKANRFTITRPGARLHGFVSSDVDASPRVTKLDVPDETGVFPCIEVHSGEALTHHILTVLVSRKGSDGVMPAIEVVRDGQKWSIVTDDVTAKITATTHVPEIELG